MALVWSRREQELIFCHQLSDIAGVVLDALLESSPVLAPDVGVGIPGLLVEQPANPNTVTATSSTGNAQVRDITSMSLLILDWSIAGG
ncbi:MAG TPA: hypothetical protein VHX38_16835 [Pseudonocardiaceae bacterium]|nr:hypothetical protein [Pseudonocardiaceae bacterium]